MTRAPSDTVWNDRDLTNPHVVADKRRRVQRMFAAIAPCYDVNNRVHSIGLDQYWRRRAVALAQLRPGDSVVDVACGTGDLSLAFGRGLKDIAGRQGAPTAGQVLGIDFTFEMLPLAEQKLRRACPADSHATRFLAGDAQRLPLPDACCDVVSIAFGIRNVAEPAIAMREFHRVLRPQGRVIVLEFSLPANPVLRSLYNFYFHKILPRTATLISGDRTGAYKYLPRSVGTFMPRTAMLDSLRAAGFRDATAHPMTFGIAVVYRAIKR
jgi:demethylmenaquinone methyltransferase/2-methoxy-6-polyprenyl-1,4-benzoquinol methylase